MVVREDAFVGQAAARLAAHAPQSLRRSESLCLPGADQRLRGGSASLPSSRLAGLLLLAAGPEVVNCAALGITPADGVDVAPVRNASFARAALAAAARVVCEDDASQPNSVRGR